MGSALKKTTVFRADASQNIGGGHLMRCLALSDALSKSGWSCAFAYRDGTLETVPALRNCGGDLLLLDCEESQEPSALMSRWPNGVDLLVVDHYGRGASFEGACRTWAGNLLVIEDLTGRAHKCDILLNQNIDADMSLSPSGLAPGGSVLYGQEYVLLRPEFEPWRNWRRSTPAKVETLLITFGMTDTENATSTVLDALEPCLDAEVRVDIIVGPSNPHADEIRRKADDLNSAATVHFNPTNVAALMSEADLAITAAGSTCWELAFMGVPMITLTMSPDQEVVAHTLSRAGVSRPIERMDGSLEKHISGSWRLLVTDRHAREAMSRSGRALVDGMGAARVAKFLTSKIVPAERNFELGGQHNP